MMEWNKLSDKYPDSPLVLGYDNFDKDEDRFAVCEASKDQINVRCRDEKYRTFLLVQNSIAPYLSTDTNCHWMELPEKDDHRWIAFDEKNSPFSSGDLVEVLIQLYNGNYYVGFIESLDWCPSFNMFKHGNLESIKSYMNLPEPPRS